jgi:ligand-binding sensor protein
MRPLIFGKYVLEDIIDLEKLRILLQKFADSTGLALSLMEEGTNDIKIEVGFTHICRNFFRVNKDSVKNCIASNIDLQKYSEDGAQGLYSVSCCKNGLIDGAAPILVEGVHLANLHIGQILFEAPNKRFFKSLANKYAFEKKEFMSALAKVKIVDEDAFIEKLKFIASIAELVAKKGMNKIKLMEREKSLQGLIPICPKCKKVRTDKGYWERIESFIELNTDVDTWYHYCPDCSDLSRD